MPDSRTRQLLPAFWVAAFLAAFLPLAISGFFKHFTADDYWFAGHGNIEDDPSVCSLSQTFTGDWLSGARGEGGWLRPLPRMLFYGNDKLFGIENPWGYHLTNALLHGLNAAFVAILLGGLLQGRFESWRSLWRGPPAAAAGGLLFALFPQTSGAASWISGRTDLLAVFFLLAAGVVFLLPLARWWRLPAVFVLTLLSIFSKESGFFTPVLLAAFFFALWLGEGKETRPPFWKSVLLPAAVSASAAALSLGWRLHFLGGLGGYPDQFGGKGATDFAAWVKDYLLTTANAGLGALFLLLEAALVLGALLLLWRRGGERRWRASLLFGLAAWAIAAVPVAGLPLTPVENDRFLYFAALGVAVFLAGCFQLWYQGERHLRSAGVLLLVLMLLPYGAEFLRRNARWGEASRQTRSIVSQLVRFAEECSERPFVMVFRDMDFLSYEHEGLHTYRGAKVLPWDQASWALWRESRGEHTGSWGIRPEAEPSALEAGGCFVFIDREDEEFSLSLYRAEEPLTTGTMVIDGAHYLPFEELAARSEHEGPFYGFARLELEAEVGYHPAVRRGERSVHSHITTAPGSSSSHPVNVGLNPAGAGEWWYLPEETPGKTRVRKILVALFPLSPLNRERSSNQEERP